MALTSRAVGDVAQETYVLSTGIYERLPPKRYLRFFAHWTGLSLFGTQEHAYFQCTLLLYVCKSLSSEVVFPPVFKRWDARCHNEVNMTRLMRASVSAMFAMHPTSRAFVPCLAPPLMPSTRSVFRTRCHRSSQAQSPSLTRRATHASAGPRMVSAGESPSSSPSPVLGRGREVR